MNLLLRDLKKVPFMVIAYVIMAIGLTLTKQAGLGMAPWGVLHEGISITIGMDFGQVVRNLGFIIMFLSLFIKVYPGIGTIFNILIIGATVDLVDQNINFMVVDTFWYSFIVFGIGFIIYNIATAYYITLDLGKGPRDGVFVGMVKLTKLDTKYVKPIIELSVITIGLILGGKVGIGTVILMLFSGYIIDFTFKILKFDPKTRNNTHILEYFKKTNSDI